MLATAEPTLDQVLNLAHRLSRAARAELIARLARDLVAEEPVRTVPARTPFPVMSGGTWHADLPQTREALYGESGRG